MKKNGWVQFTPKLFSIFKSGYSFADFRSDALAGLIVAIVALPLGMALAIACGVTPEKGLITVVIAGGLISIFGGSRVQIGGPTGAFVVIVYDVIIRHGFDGLLIATLLAGLILIIAGYLKLGQIIKFIPYPVVMGFTAGIAVIIASTQFKNFFGLQLGTVPAAFIAQWKTYFAAAGTINLITVLVGVSCLGLILFLRKVAPRLPGFLIALVLSSIVVKLFHLEIGTIGSQFHHISSGLSLPHLPDWNLAKIQQVLPSAFTIAFLAGIEALLSAMVADGMTGYKHRANQELIGQGIANIASAAFGGLPATGAIARTATNVTSGGKTPVAGVVHAFFVLLFILFASDLMLYVPMTALASILFLVAWRMSEVDRCFHIVRLSVHDAVLFLLTFVLTVFVDLTIAIAAGVVAAALFFMMKMSRSVEIALGKKEGLDKKEHDQREVLPHGIEAIWISGPIFFGMVSELIDTFKTIGMPKVLIVRMRLVPYLDSSGASAIRDLSKQCHRTHTPLIFSTVQKQPSQILHKTIEKKGVYYTSSYEEAVTLATELLGSEQLIQEKI